ncbi:hypothetical protein INT47_012363 [Mucor saturninus]|uniref:Uncharacterized protein n=1 Tax=Mucor saturninus TaxID=64648 RepID=A0A8H7QYC4_9FUNG|nr:hypothetical protein INT47_012363 [Mucor saturninus]
MPNTFWRLIFTPLSGIERATVQAYNTSNMYANFMSQAQMALDPYNIKIKSITLKVPQQEKIKEMEITSQADFLRVLNLIPVSDAMYDPNRGIEAYVHQEGETVKSPDSGYASGANEFF